MKLLLQILLPLVVIAAGVAAAAGLVASRAVIQPETPEVVPPLVETVSASRDSVTLYVHTHGTVVPRTESRLASEVVGRVQAVSEDWVDGGFFEAGDVLVELDATDYLVSLRDAEQRVAQAILRVEQEEADAKVAREDWIQMHGDAPAPALVVREPQLREARAALEAARASREKAQRDVDRCRVLAPYAGRVRTRMVDVGTVVQPGTELGRIYGTDAVEVRLPLPDAELEFLDLPLSWSGEDDEELAPRVELATEFAGRKHRWEGTIVRTEGELAPDSRMVVAVARVPDPYGRDEITDRPPLAPGMFVEATIEGVQIDDAVALPRSALRSGNRVNVLEDDRLAVRTVDVLRSEADRVLLRSGVVPGDSIVVTPLEMPVDGMRLRQEENE